MFIAKVISKGKHGKSYTSLLLRESSRVGAVVKSKTLAVLTHLPVHVLEAVRRAIAQPADSLSQVAETSNGSLRLRQAESFGALWIVDQLAQQLNIKKALGVTRQAELGYWQVLARVLRPGSSLLVALRMMREPELRRAWLPVVFPEEQFGVASLRDFLAAILRELSAGGLPDAKAWLEKVEAESNDEQSQQLAVTGLTEITRKTHQRLVVFVENLNLLLEECLDDQMKGTLRRLLMTDPFMMLIGSSVHVFDSLKSYDEAFFNYFGPVPLDRLSAEQVFELLQRRAEFDGNERFLRDFREQRPKIRAIVHLAGGNPRLILMLYELLSQRQVTTIVQCLRRLVDELTPLLKDEMENLPPQQRKIVHALMEKGGTAQPTDLVERTRLPLNAITTQLKRLKDAQIVEVLGGGKGRAANYTVPDKLFAIWYQMRYLNQNRRRIELFVEVLRIWFEAEERFATIQSFARLESGASPSTLRDAAMTTEYFAASLGGTPYASEAREHTVRRWLKSGDYHEAALAHADFAKLAAREGMSFESAAYMRLGEWCAEHKDLKTALEVLNPIISDAGRSASERADFLLERGCCFGISGDYQRALSDFAAVVKLEGVPKEQVAEALFNRGVAKWMLGDTQGALADFTAVVMLEGVSKEQVAWALFNCGQAKWMLGDTQGELADYTAVVTLKGAPKEPVALALFNRGVTKGRLGDTQGALADYTAVVTLEGAPKEQVAQALLNRGFAKGMLGDTQGALADCTAVLALEGAPKEPVAKALFNRGVTKGRLGDTQGALADYTAVVTLEGAPKEQVADALLNRGVAKGVLSDTQGELADYTAVVTLEGAPKEQVADALFNRGFAKGMLGDTQGALADYTAVVTLGDALKEQVAKALVNRGFTNLALGQKASAIEDWTAVLKLGASFEDGVSIAAESLFCLYWPDGATNEANNALDHLARHLATKPSDQRVLALTEFLARLASPAMRQGWLHAARRLLGAQPPETRQSLGFLEPVCTVLDGGEKSLLDPLPPEQREFALKVLASFDPEKNSPAVPASAIANLP